MSEFASPAERAPTKLFELGARSPCECPESFGAFFLGEIPVGFLSSSADKNIRSAMDLLPLLECRRGGIALRTRQTSSASLTRLLSRFVNLCIEAGLLPSLKGEAIDVLSPDGHKIAAVDRAAARLLGIRTRVVRLHAHTENGKTVFQRRSKTKSVCPGLLDNFAAGMIACGESPLEALKREILEETGIKAEDISLQRRNDLDFECLCRIPEGVLNEETIVYETVLPDTLTPQNSDGEVEGFLILTDREAAAEMNKGRIMREAAFLHVTQKNADQ